MLLVDVVFPALYEYLCVEAEHVVPDVDLLFAHFNGLYRSLWVESGSEFKLAELKIALVTWMSTHTHYWTGLLA